MIPEKQIPTLLSLVDYFIQAALVLLAFVSPWLIAPGHSLRAFGLPFLLTLCWCLWRMGYFDPATDNDVPGIGYIFVGFALGIIALVFHALRTYFARRGREP